jgi:MFS family permease
LRGTTANGDYGDYGDESATHSQLSIVCVRGAMTIAASSSSRHDTSAWSLLRQLRQNRVTNRWVLYAYALVGVSLTAGAVYGWPSLRQALRTEDDNNAASTDAPAWASETALGAAFTAGAWSSNGLRFVTGMARDRWGTGAVLATCYVAAALGAVGIALASTPRTMGVALFCQGIGSGVQLCVQPYVANLFPKYSGAVLASFSGAFQVSGLAYLVVTKTFASRQTGFCVYAAAILACALVGLVLLPPTRGPAAATRKGQSVHEDDEDVSKDRAMAATAITDMVDDTEEAHVAASSDDAAVIPSTREHDTVSAATPVAQKDGTLIWTIITSWKYLLLVQWLSLTITPLQYYIGSLGFQLETKGDDTGKYIDLFSILYGSAAALSPAGGYLADRYTLGLAQGLATALAAISFFVLASDASLPLQSIGLACNAAGRMWIFGIYFAHVGRVFGYENYGTLAGFGLLMSAIVSLLQYPLLVAAANGHATVTNCACGSVVLCELTYCYWLHRQSI